MALPPSTANWHWKSKHVMPWARQWFERELVTLSVKGDGDEVVGVEQVTSVEGDVELGQRKSKLITIFDCNIQLKWAGTASDGTSVTGTLNIPEVSHETTVDGLSDYTFDWSLTTTSSGPVDALYKLARTRLATAFETKLSEFPSALIDTHGKDLTVSGEPSPSPTPHPAAAPAAAVPAATEIREKLAQKTTKAINVETVKVEATFQAAADDLFSILTDEKRIPHWSRAPAQSKAQVGTDYSLFGGGVTGSYKALTPGKEVVQTWVLNSPTWPSGHVGTLKTTFDQSTDSTKVVFALSGVPKGLEDETRRNLEGYYVHGLKAIGYVQLVLAPRPSPPSSPSRSPRSSLPPGTSNTTRLLAVLVGFLALGAAFAVPWLTSRR